MHSEMREIGPTIVMLFWIWYELSRTKTDEISQIYLNLTEISEYRQEFISDENRMENI